MFPLTSLLLKCFDTYSELEQIATDRNLILVRYDDEWAVLSSNGSILNVGDSPVCALAAAIFKLK